jgi:hypothetical protein
MGGKLKYKSVTLRFQTRYSELQKKIRTLVGLYEHQGEDRMKRS